MKGFYILQVVGDNIPNNIPNNKVAHATHPPEQCSLLNDAERGTHD